MIDRGEYPQFLRELLASCPHAGNGVHPWLFRVARYLHRYHSPEQICEILKEHVAQCGREIEPHEIPDAVRNSGAHTWKPKDKSAHERREEWFHPVIRSIPKFQPEIALAAAARVRQNITPEWLKEHSPVPVPCPTEEYLKLIFEPGEKALIFNDYKSQGILWPGGFSIDYWPGSSGRTEHGSCATRSTAGATSIRDWAKKAEPSW